MKRILLLLSLLLAPSAFADDLVTSVNYNTTLGVLQALTRANGYMSLPVNTSVPMVYSFNTLGSPTSGTLTVFPAGSLYSSPSWATVSYSSGTLTTTFNQAGWYRVSLDGENNFGNAYTSAQNTITYAGTALYYGSASTINCSIPSSSQNLNFNCAHIAYIQATASGQTITILPKFAVNAASVNSSSTFVISIQKL